MLKYTLGKVLHNAIFHKCLTLSAYAVVVSMLRMVSEVLHTLHMVREMVRMVRMVRMVIG